VYKCATQVKPDACVSAWLNPLYFIFVADFNLL